ncbi:MAG: hypothetical protein JST59_28970 [Actinobacteria bacterium]|nr:hypothetical protein [Actinomycetota bacterium]
MPDPVAMILHLAGDPDEVLERFEEARRPWIAAEGDGYDPPAFYAACRTQDGIVVSAWDSEEAHSRFGRGIRPHLKAAGL